LIASICWIVIAYKRLFASESGRRARFAAVNVGLIQKFTMRSKNCVFRINTSFASCATVQTLPCQRPVFLPINK